MKKKYVCLFIFSDITEVVEEKEKNSPNNKRNTNKNKICLLKNNIITNMVIDPQDVGLQRGNISDIQIDTKEDAIKSFVDVLNDTANKTKIEITALNAAGGLIVSDIANSFDEAVELALATIHSGKAFDKLKNFVKNCGDMEKLEEVERS